MPGLEEINGDLLEADFWPGATSGLSLLGLRPAKPYENNLSSTASWLENPRTPRPTGDVALQERSEIFGEWWKFPAPEPDLRKVEGHHRVD